MSVGQLTLTQILNMAQRTVTLAPFSFAAKALAFFKESPEYSDKMTITDKYNTHFASQYREKVGRTSS